MKNLRPVVRIMFCMLLLLLPAKIFAQDYTYTYVHNDPGKLRGFAFIAGGYFDSWKVNPQGGINFGIMMHLPKIMQVEMETRIPTAQKIWKKDAGMSITRGGNIRILLGFNVARNDRVHYDHVTVNGYSYRMEAMRRHALCMRMGFDANITGYDGSLNATFTDTVGGVHTVTLGMMSTGYVAVGLSYKQTQNTWINISGAYNNPIPVGHMTEVYADILILAALDMGKQKFANYTKVYDVVPDGKQKMGWRCGFRMFMPIRSGITWGLEGGSRPAAGLPGMMLSRNGYFAAHLSFYIAPGKPGL